MKLKKNIVLIGMMGSGKSTIGRLLAKKMKKQFIDVDKKIEELEKLKIKEIFEKKGENFFRNIEFNLSNKFLAETDCIISLGGGAFLNRLLRKTIKQSSYSFWLCWHPGTLIKRIKNKDKRPVIKNMTNIQIKKIIKERNKTYSKSDFKIICDNHNKNEIIHKIEQIYKKNEVIN